jgi:tetratricopeptide (TPR) repeat protein
LKAISEEMAFGVSACNTAACNTSQVIRPDRSEEETVAPARPRRPPPDRPRRGDRPDRRGPRAARNGPGAAEPAVPDEITGNELDREVRAELRTLPRELAEQVARHLVAAAELLDAEPELAYAHALAARRRAARIPAVREAAGLAAYRAGHYAETLRELRAARRMSGSAEHLPLMADAERGLGRPERALEIAAGDDVKALDRAGQVEMRIVEAGARRDMGQLDAALNTLEGAGLRPAKREPWLARLRFAYADALLAAGRADDARDWFARAAEADLDEETDAADRLAELDGVRFIEE